MGSGTPISLVKYLSASNGLSVLKDELIRWNAPHAFLDPFEITYDTPLGFDQESFTREAIKQIISMLFARDDPSGALTPIKKAVKRWRVEQRFSSEEEASEALIHLLPTMVKKHFDDISDLVNRWRLYAYNVRVLCLSDGYRDIGLWQTRADHHRGVAIRFRVGADHTFLKPLKVHYRSNRSQLISLADELDLFTGAMNAERNSDLESRFLSKGKQFASQREWRLITRARKPMSPDHQGTGPLYEMRPFQADEIMAVYFGVAMSKTQKINYLNVIEEAYPNVKCYVGRLCDREYDLQFEHKTIDEIREST